MGQKTENLFGRESMQPNPERAALRRSPAEEERLTEFNAYSMTTKGSVLAHITDQIIHVQHPAIREELRDLHSYRNQQCREDWPENRSP